MDVEPKLAITFFVVMVLCAMCSAGCDLPKEAKVKSHFQSISGFCLVATFATMLVWLWRVA